MTFVEDVPRFAVFFLPWRSYRCDPCRIALSYPLDEDEDETAPSEVKNPKCTSGEALAEGGLDR
jgi:hypothetical protein